MRFDVLRYLLLFLSGNGENSHEVYRIVNTNDGVVRGKMNTTLLNQKQYFSFRGIPYSKPPIGELRFKPPEPIDSRRFDVFDAFEYGKGCPQISDDNIDNSEDCLFINIFVPDVKAEGLLPVLFYLHGGIFVEGTSDDLLSGPDFLMEKEVILVTFNYRIGLLGFVSFGTPEYSGNMSLKDQLLALKWTHENIANFGGDNTRITMGGHSSGGMCIGYHMFNEESTRYFQQTITLSGTSNLVNIDGDHYRLMRAFAERRSNSTIDNIDDLIGYFKNLSVQEILQASADLGMYGWNNYEGIWMPIIGHENALRPFILEDTQTLLKRSCCLNITSYYTFTNRETLQMIGYRYFDVDEMNHYLNNFYAKLPIKDYAFEATRKPYLTNAMNELRDFYFANASTQSERMDRRVIMDSDIMFVYATDKFARIHVNNSCANIFYHRFSADTRLNTYKNVVLPGATHADDLCYLFRCRRYTDLYNRIIQTANTDSDSAIALEVIGNLTDLMANFVKYENPAISGHPVDGFKPTEANVTYFLDMTNDGLFMGTSPNNDRTDFMDYIIEKVSQLIDVHGDIVLPIMDRFYNYYMQLD